MQTSKKYGSNFPRSYCGVNQEPKLMKEVEDNLNISGLLPLLF